MNNTENISRSVKSNFGIKGWNIIIFVGVMLLMCSGVNNDGLNISVSGIAALRGWDPALLLSYGTIATIVSVFGVFAFAKLCDIKGARFVSVLTLILGGACYIWVGYAHSPIEYAVAFCAAAIFTNAFAWAAGGVYMAQWFPKKKGLAMGWATMGNNLCTAIFVPILNILMIKFGISMAITIIGAVIIAMAIWAALSPDSPEKAGATPDNMPMNADDIAKYREEANAYVSPWTMKKLIKTKEFWTVSLCLGCTMLATVGVISQLVTRLITGYGFEQTQAVSMMSICAIIGIVGSYVWGVIDQKITTKKAVVLYMFWYALAIVFNLLPGKGFLYISIFMIGCAIGGNANWPVSLTSSVFGYKNFSRVYPLINGVKDLMRSFAYAVLAISLTLTGSLAGAYVVFIAILLIGAIFACLVDDKKYADGVTCPD